MLTFFAQDADTHTLIYANADLSKASQHREILAFADYWRDLSGAWPAQLVFDQRLCTHAELGEPDARGISSRSPGEWRTCPTSAPTVESPR